MRIKKHFKLFVVIILLCCMCSSTHATAAEYTYDDNCEYVLETFRLEDPSYYPYLPLHIDPVSYSGVCGIVGGLNDDTYYVGYSYYKAEDIGRYLDYLQYWGYKAAETPCTIPDMMAWHLVGTDPNAERRPLVPVIDIYHAVERELLIVAYSYLDAWLYDAWLEVPEWVWTHNPFKAESLPYTLQLREDAAISVEEVRLTKELFIIADEELPVYPYSLPLLKERDLAMSAVKIEEKWLHHWKYDRKSTTIPYILCIRISFDKTLRDEILHSLRAATANVQQSQYGDCVDVSMIFLSQYAEDDILFTSDLCAAESEVWLVFPPGCGIDTLQRLYFCLEKDTDPWIGDLRDWSYMNVYLDENHLVDN